MLTFAPKRGTIAPDMGTSPTDNNIASALFGTVRQRVLALLFGHADQAYYLREITRAVDAGHGAVQRELKQLVDSGLLTRTRRGNQVFYQANQESPVFAELRGLVLKTAGVADVLREALADLAGRIEVAFVYGSIAEGTDRSDSDVDLMIIGEVGLRALGPVLRPAQETLDREVNPVTMTPQELADRVAHSEHFVQTVLPGPKIFLIGDENDLNRLAEGVSNAEA